MYRVLLAIDTNQERMDQAVKTVTDLPGHEKISVTVLNVFEAFDATDEGGRVDSESLYDESNIPESVELARERLENTDIETTVRREHGKPAETILRVASEIDANAVVMTGRKRSPTGKVLFGSVTQSVLLSAECPVIVTTTG